MKDINIQIVAVIVTLCMALLTFGYVWGAYIYIGIMAYTSFNTIIASAGVLNGLVNPMDSIKELKDNGWVRPSKLTTLLGQIIHSAMLYKMYLAGFIFSTGFFAAIMAIGVVGNALLALEGEEE